MSSAFCKTRVTMRKIDQRKRSQITTRDAWQTASHEINIVVQFDQGSFTLASLNYLRLLQEHTEGAAGQELNNTSVGNTVTNWLSIFNLYRLNTQSRARQVGPQLKSTFVFYSSRPPIMGFKFGPPLRPLMLVSPPDTAAAAYVCLSRTRGWNIELRLICRPKSIV